ncbi:MAG TPA: capsule assembly Wzi family protein [Longimicrobium sp.]|nr:capsule assembly Wzi family protein [Longimicrobium sp.]
MREARRVMGGVSLRSFGLACALAYAVPLAAQDTVSAAFTTGRMLTILPADSGVQPGSSPLLPPEHWAVRAAARAKALGLADRYLPAQGAVPRHAVSAALAAAAARARETRPDLLPLAEGWGRRFAEEFSEYERAPASFQLQGARLAVGADDHTGRLEPAFGVASRYRDPVALENRGRLYGEAAGGVLVGGVASAFAEVRANGGGDFDARRWQVGVGVGAVELSVGEQPVAYGTLHGGGLLFSGAQPLPRVEVQTLRPVRLPSFLRALGPVSFHTFLSRMDEEARHPGDPWMWGARVAFEPHPRFTAALARGSIFGGDSIESETNFENVAKMLVGVLSDEFENQIVAMDFRWRLPTEETLPATLYLEWGADDGAGAWWESPGIVAGAYVPAIPGLPEVSVGAEGAFFRAACCGHGSWFTNESQIGGWVRGGQPLAHPLGGEGYEAALYTRMELLDARLRVDARGFVRHRGDEGLAEAVGAANLFAPQRAGGSFGGVLDAAWRVTPSADVRVRLFGDRGDGWTERRVEAAVAFFPF